MGLAHAKAGDGEEHGRFKGPPVVQWGQLAQGVRKWPETRLRPYPRVPSVSS